MHQHSRRQFFGVAGATAAAMAISGHFPAEARASEAAKAKCSLKLGLASYSLRKFSLEDALKMTQQVGLKHICLKSYHLPLDASPEKIAAAVAEVKAAEIDLYGCGVVPMKKPADVDQAFKYAKAAGMRTIVGVPYPDVLSLVNEKVKQYDIAVAIHNHGPGDKVYPTPTSAIEKVKDLDPRIGLCMDIGHTVRIGEDPCVDAERYADRLLDVHVKDVSEATAKGRTVEVGRGVIDIPRFLETLVKIKYSRIVSFEYEANPADPLVGLAESVGYVRGVLATL